MHAKYFTLYIVALASLSNLLADDVFAPLSILGGHEGNSSLGPLYRAPFAIRYQQVYAASNFLSVLPTTASQIYSVEFRVDAFRGFDFDAIITNIQVDLSTTTRNPDELSPVFDENVGSDRRTLIASTSYHLQGSGGGGSIGPWGIRFWFLDNPFYYDAAQGNLLLDIRRVGGEDTTYFDAWDVVGDSVSSVFGEAGFVPPSQGQTSTIGLSTLFVVLPVPEPSSWALLLSGAAFTVMVLRRRTHHPK